MNNKYEFGEVGIHNGDGTFSGADKYGNEALMQPDGTYKVIEGGFKNPLGLEFVDGDGLEFIILREIERSYCLDELGLNSDSVVIDIGAHVGVVSMHIAKKYGSRVTSYEPAPNNYRRLVANIEANNLSHLITPHNLAVTHDGRDVVIGGPGSESSGGMCIYQWLYARPGTPFTDVKSIAFLDVIGGRDIDLLKIDCEGAEHEIFYNMDILKTVKAIRGEFHDINGATASGQGFSFSGRDLLERVKQVVPDTKIPL